MFSVACSGSQACGQVLADAVEWPAQPIRAWLAILAEPLARYDSPVVLEALGGAMSAPIFCGLSMCLCP